MTPERMAALVARWVRFYTRNLPAPIAERRMAEIDSDLHDHIEHERAHGTNDWRIALSIAARMVRGLAADAAWRGETIARSPTPKEVKKMSPTVYRSAVRIALATAALALLLPLVGMLISDGWDWGVFDFVFAAVLVAGVGVLLELAAQRAGKLVYLAVAAAIGVAAIVFGESDDAPGLVGFGCLLIVGTVVLAVRTPQRSG